MDQCLYYTMPAYCVAILSGVWL